MSENPSIGVRNIRPELVFVILALLFGVIFVVVTGPLQVSDESLHFFRAYHISQGDFISVRQDDVAGGSIPRSLVHLNGQYSDMVYHPEVRIDKETFLKNLGESFDTKDRTFTSFQTQALYAPIVYIPQAIGIAVGRLCCLSALKIMYLGRFANLLCWIGMVYLSIRVVPVLKWIFFLCALMPMNISQAASLSADGLTNGATMLLTALILNEAFGNKESFGKSRALAIAFLSVLISLAKQAYLPLVCLVLLIPAQRFGTKRNKIVYCSVVIVAAALATGVWSLKIRNLYVSYGGSNATEQISFLMSCPWKFPAIAFNSIISYWRGIAASFIGILGWIQIWLPFWIYFTFPFVLIAAAITDTDGKVRIRWFQRCWILFLCVCIVVLVELSMYLAWSKPGAMLVEGVQGRHFIPIAVPVFLSIFYNRWLKFPKPAIFHLAIVLYSASVLTAACWTVYVRYFGMGA